MFRRKSILELIQSHEAHFGGKIDLLLIKNYIKAGADVNERNVAGKIFMIRRWITIIILIVSLVNIQTVVGAEKSVNIKPVRVMKPSPVEKEYFSFNKKHAIEDIEEAIIKVAKEESVELKFIELAKMYLFRRIVSAPEDKTGEEFYEYAIFLTPLHWGNNQVQVLAVHVKDYTEETIPVTTQEYFMSFLKKIQQTLEPQRVADCQNWNRMHVGMSIEEAEAVFPTGYDPSDLCALAKQPQTLKISLVEGTIIYDKECKLSELASDVCK